MFVACLVAIFAYRFDAGLFPLAFAAVFTAVLAAREPSLGLAAVFGELFSNPHGHLFFFDDLAIPVSLRMAVFIGFFVGWAVFFIRTGTLPHLHAWRFAPLIPLTLAILIGFTVGLASQPTLDAFKDGNAYLYLLYAFPILTTEWTSARKHQLLQLFAAGAVWNLLLTLVILYVFTHFDEGILRSSYVFLRDIRLAEITNLGNGTHRIFIQSQFFTLALGALLLAFMSFSHRKIVPASVALGSVIAVILLSLSRSFWIGIAAAFLVLLILLARSGVRAWFPLALRTFLGGVFAIILILVVALFPLPSQRLGGGELADALRRRSETDVAVSSRWALIPPMKNAIAEHPVFGSGFGQRVSFITDDPRARELRPDGVWSTYAMEWGWLELWLKMGILGPLGFLFLFVSLVVQLLKQNTHQAWVGIGLVSGLVFLYATHAFSPYLNHPIGLGFLLFTMAFLPTPAHPIPQTAVPTGLPLLKQTRAPSSAVSLQSEVK